MRFFRSFSQAAALLALLTGTVLTAWGFAEAWPHLYPMPYQMNESGVLAQDGMLMMMAGVPLVALGTLVMLIEAWRRKHGEGIKK